MKKIQPFRIKGSDITVYIEVEDIEDADNFTKERKQENIPAGKKIPIKETIREVVAELSADVVLAPAVFFAKQLHNSIDKMENKPEKAKIEFYSKIAVGTGNMMNIVTNINGEASMKVILEWNIEQKK